ncbi:zinc metallopeptidase mde10 [Pseudozyma hubeiensis SY62]|uniref:Zinc metallopeptidase mde10 n=1 Tax=Pseudozyma hubeiensis (strain SY62) TaxID=1305764 RepID=R9PBX4_PSEHS|nr:zinc metallopeptidase mde10 [Pseudozyma hubeiensis SY62]GAC98829.1 zinc metallopeptidase mde10 [Pseudozyma hubeiensis SY62]
MLASHKGMQRTLRENAEMPPVMSFTFSALVAKLMEADDANVVSLSGAVQGWYHANKRQMDRNTFLLAAGRMPNTSKLQCAGRDQRRQTLFESDAVLLRGVVRVRPFGAADEVAVGMSRVVRGVSPHFLTLC